MVTTIEGFLIASPEKIKSPKKSFIRELGIEFKSQGRLMVRSLLLTAAVGFGIKLDHDHRQAIAELAKPAFTVSQIDQRRQQVHLTGYLSGALQLAGGLYISIRCWQIAGSTKTN